MSEAQAPIGYLPGETIEPTGSSPLPPIEKHAVGAALTASRMLSYAQQLVALLQTDPRNDAAFALISNGLHEAHCETFNHYLAFQAVLTSKGQA